MRLPWESGGVVGPNHSVGHVAAAVLNAKGQWEIVQSQFPHAPGGDSTPIGPNTTIAKAKDLIEAEGNRKPNSAFLVTVKDMEAYARAAIHDLQKPTWFVRPTTGTQTNCTVGVCNSLRAGGLAWAPYLMFRGPRDMRVFLDDESHFNVIHPYKVHRRDDLIDAPIWGGI